MLHREPAAQCAHTRQRCVAPSAPGIGVRVRNRLGMFWFIHAQCSILKACRRSSDLVFQPLRQTESWQGAQAVDAWPLLRGHASGSVMTWFFPPDSFMFGQQDSGAVGDSDNVDADHDRDDFADSCRHDRVLVGIDVNVVVTRRRC